MDVNMEDYRKRISEVVQKYNQYINEFSTELDLSAVEKFFSVMGEVNNDEQSYVKNFPEGINNLGHEDVMHDFYEVKNKLGKIFIKACSNLPKEDLNKVSKEHPASYIMQENENVINDKISIYINDDNYFTIVPSRVDAKEEIAEFVQDYVDENNPISSGKRTLEDITGAYDLRKVVTEVKNNIANNINHCSEQDIVDYIQQCCAERTSGNVDDKRKAEIMLSVLQNARLTDQGVSMPSNATVAEIVSLYDKGEINLETMNFELLNTADLYHELHTVDEIMNVMRVSEEEANRLLEEESEPDYNGVDTVFYNEEPFSTYLVIEDGGNFATDGFVLEDSLTKKQKEQIGLVPVEKKEASKRPENLQYKIGEIDSFKKAIQEMAETSNDKITDLRQMAGRLEDKEQKKDSQIPEQ